MDYRKQVESEVKGTVGYDEAENKKSFMTGVGVAISKLEAKYEILIKELEQQLKYANQNVETYKKDLTTLASIINRYSENND